jgi:antitoxin CcdA
MSLLYNENAPKKPTNLTVNTDLLSQAKALNINISSILESALIETLKKNKRDEWLKENEGPIQAYNAAVKQNGIFSDGNKTF